MHNFIHKCRHKIKSKKEIHTRYIIQSAIIFVSLLIVEFLGTFLNNNLLVAPFGASCAIIFCFSESPFSRPQNVIGGYFICSLIGVATSLSFGNNPWTVAIAVSMSVLIMLLFGLMHPPAAAVTIIAVTSGAGWIFILFPVVTGAIVIVIVAVFDKMLIQKLFQKEPIKNTSSQRPDSIPAKEYIIQRLNAFSGLPVEDDIETD